MLISELESLKENHTLISIERYCSEDDLIGYVVAIKNEIVVLSLISDEGEFDGFSAFELSQIREIWWGNREHKALHNLAKPNSTVSFHPKAENLIAAINEFQEHFDHVGLYTADGEESFSIGELSELDEGWLKLHTYGTFNSLSRRYQLHRTSDVLRVTACSPYESKIIKSHASEL